jgi:hypothetical protein
MDLVTGLGVGAWNAVTEVPLQVYDVVRAVPVTTYTALTGNPVDITFYSSMGRAAMAGASTTELMHSVNPVYGLMVGGYEFSQAADSGDMRAMGEIGGAIVGGTLLVKGATKLPGFEPGMLSAATRQFASDTAYSMGEAVFGKYEQFSYRMGATAYAVPPEGIGSIVANSTGRIAYSGDVYATDFVGPVKWEYFYRGDATARTEFLSSMAQERGVPATTEFLNSRSSAQFNDIYAEHGISSQGLPTIGVSDNRLVAEYFARGPGQNQSGFVTTFRLESRDAAKFAVPNYENPQSFFEINPSIGLPEREYLFHPQIDPKYIYQQIQVVPK